jgi:type IV pilus assembly protein PilW
MRDERGLTLAELLVALAALGLLLAGLLGLLDTGLVSYATGAARVDIQQGVRLALERMARELREAGYDPTGAGIAPVVLAEPTRLVFQRDLNGNGLIDPTRERVTFLLRGSVLRRDAGGGAQPVLAEVRRLAFSYRDRAHAPTTDPARVTLVRIELEAGPAGAVVTMATEAAVRNAP